MNRNLPDFIVIGAMKCGTTTLAAQLAAQAGIFMTTPKEPNFFSDDQIYARGIGWYQSLFEGSQPGDLLGEASTHYTKLPTYGDTVPRMREVLRLPKLVYMIRNPVQRAVSHYIHEWSEARMGPDMEAAFEAQPELVQYGCYGKQIAPFIEAYGADQVILTSLERLKADQDQELARITDFFGYQRIPIWHHDLGTQNVSSARARRFPLQSVLIDNPIASFLRRALVPKAIRNKIRQSRTIGDRPEINEALRTRLEAAFTEDHQLLSRYFPNHPALNDSYPFLNP